jgi:hypothetical protein
MTPGINANLGDASRPPTQMRSPGKPGGRSLNLQS